MGRMMPLTCDHGVTIDWGDFGPCQDCRTHPGADCPNLGGCAACEAESHALTPLDGVAWCLQHETVWFEGETECINRSTYEDDAECIEAPLYVGHAIGEPEP